MSTAACLRVSIGAALLVALLALVHVTASAATTGRTFFDTRNETPGAPDIRKVTVSQEGDILDVHASVVGMPLLAPGMCGFALDTDGNPATGSIAGAEYFVAFDLKTFQGDVLRWNGTRYVNAKKLADPSSSVVGAGDCGFTFNLANFRWPKAIGLKMAVSSGSGSSALNDVAPNDGEWLFPVVQQPESLELSFEPKRPVRGTTFGATTPSLTLTDKTVVTPSRVTCRATVDGVDLPSAGGAGACRWRIPADAAGKQLVVTATAGYRGRRTSYDPWKFRIG
jgi:hypothetical protein